MDRVRVEQLDAMDVAILVGLVAAACPAPPDKTENPVECIVARCQSMRDDAKRGVKIRYNVVTMDDGETLAMTPQRRRALEILEAFGA